MPNPDATPNPTWRRYLRFWGQNVSADVDDELRFHLERRVQEFVRQGWNDADARRIALHRFGDVDDVRRACGDIGQERLRSERRRAAAADLGQDIAYALRILGRQRLPAFVIVLCLALGIGATTTVFAVGDALLLRPSPFPNGPRLVQAGPLFRTMRGMSVSSFEDFSDWQARQRSFDALGAIRRETYVITRNEPVRVAGASVTSGVFRALGVHAQRGRLLLPSDDAPAAARIVVISAAFAERVLGGVDSAVGRSISLSGRSYGPRAVERQTFEVVGVLPDRFAYPEGLHIWTSMPRVPNATARNSRSLDVVGALREGVTIEAAQRDLAGISAQLASEYPEYDAGMSAVVRPLRDRYVGAARPAFAAIAAGAVLLLLIACANVASLQLARASSRVREVAVRTALGAARGRLVRMLLTESVILAVVGGALGVAIAVAATGVVARAIPARLAPWMAPTIDVRVLGFTIVVAMLAGIAFGMAPAFRLAGISPARMLHDGGRGGFDPRRMLVQRSLVAAEVALSLVVLVGATLSARSFSRLTRLDPGFDPRGVVTFRLSLQGPQYDSAAGRVRLVEQLAERLAALPNVEAASAAAHLPIADCCSRFGLFVEGEVRDRNQEHLVTGNIVTPEFFRALKIALVRGRYLAEADRSGAQEVLVINETFERELFKGKDAIGRIVHLGSRDAVVVGVVRDVRQTRLMDGPEPQFYRTQGQQAWDYLTFAVRVRDGDPGSVIRSARLVLRELDPSLPIDRTVPMTELINGAVATQRTFSLLLTGFALIALVLATAGIYGVSSYYVSHRTSEMGIRMALGAHPRQLLGLVVRQTVTLAATGMVIGLFGAWVAAKFFARVLYSVSPTEPMVYATAAGVLVATAVVASVGPARRAVSVNPTVALKAE